MIKTLIVAWAVAAQLCGQANALEAGAARSDHQRGPVIFAQAETRDTETALRKTIGELQQGAPDYDGMEPALQQALRQHLQETVGLLKQVGAMQRIEFIGKQNGVDFYRVTFEHGIITWLIALSPAGKIAALVLRPMPAAERAGEEIAVGGMSGTLLKPAGATHPPVVLLIAGSGPTDRNGNQNGVGSNGLRQIAEALAAQGIASLRYDKRGIGRSLDPNLREEAVTFATSTKDAESWLNALRQRQDLGPLFVAGHSEGGIIAIELAKANALTGLVLLATPGRRLGDVLREQLQAVGMPDPLRDEALKILAALERGENVSTMSPALMSLFRPSVQPFLRSMLTIDPAAGLHGLTLPVLIVSGVHDIQVTAADASLLAQARPDARVLRIDGMNHVFKITPADRKDQQKAYTDPSLPLAPDLMPGIVSFIHESASARKP